jgi:hypothetical protein
MERGRGGAEQVTAEEFGASAACSPSTRLSGLMSPRNRFTFDWS